jgi:hypothetical protein
MKKNPSYQRTLVLHCRISPATRAALDVLVHNEYHNCKSQADLIDFLLDRCETEMLKDKTFKQKDRE